jgi:protein phosphatase
VEESNRVIYHEAQEDESLRGMGTTATVGAILDDFLYLAQVGDSRGYLIREGAAVQMTRDQSVVQSMMEAGTLTEEEAEASPVGNLILQALGTKPEVEVELTYQEVRRGDLLLLCSDGLSGPVKRDEMNACIQDAPDLEAACTRLVALANERGGPDNVTVVLARLDGAGLELPRPDDELGRVRWEI